MRALPQRLSGQGLEAITVVGERPGRGGRRHPEQVPAALKLAGTMAVAEEAKIPDAVKSGRQHMDQEAADELLAVESHRLLTIAVAVILVTEPDLAVGHRQEPVVGD